MKSFRQLSEEKGEKAHREAIAMGLKYKGFGYWADPATGETKYKTQNDQLVPVDPEQESELYKGGKDGDGGSPDGQGKPGMAGPGGMMNMTPMGGGMGGQNIGMAGGAPAEKPQEEDGWEAGPDGDTCVGDPNNKPGVITKDVFVGKTNYMQWQAGPDGSNAVELGALKKMVEMAEELLFEKSIGDGVSDGLGDGGDGPTRAKKVAKAVRGHAVSPMGSDTRGNVSYIQKADGPGERTKRLHDFMLDWDVTPHRDDPDYKGAEKRKQARRDERDAKKKEVEAEWDKKKGHAKRVANRVRAGSLNRKLGGEPDGPDTRRDASYLQKVATGARTPAMRQAMRAMGADFMDDPAVKLNRAALKRLADATGSPEEVKKKMQDEMKKQNSEQDAARKKQYDKDQEIVKAMNQALEQGGFFADPEYDMDYEGEVLGEGAFGKVTMGPDGDSVIKEGMIGQEELAVLRKLRDNPMFPTLLKGQFTSPFKHQSSMDNNPLDQTGKRRPEGKGDYFNPDSAAEFDDRFPGAFGKYAMSLAKGRDFTDVIDEMYENGEDLSEIYDKVFRARREMHRQGIVHNDMHGGNIKVDDDGNLQIIDLGLAEENPLAALFEGLGAISGLDGQFAMGAAPGGFGNMVNDNTGVATDKRFQNNLARIEERLMDSSDVDLDDEDAMYEKMQQLGEFIKGGIRKTKDTWPMLKEQFPMLADEKNVYELIDMLYDGFGEEPVQDRMAAAFDRLKNTQDRVLDPKSTRRLRKGEPLVPRKNLDIDD